MRQFEALGVQMFNPVQSIEISRDKLYTHQIMATKGEALTLILIAGMERRTTAQPSQSSFMEMILL
jgi:glutathione synthase/RimK-type ligase-like ATP-grasp enzyme